MTSKYLSIIIPLYNEENNISSLHESITCALAPIGINYEVIYVDDGSSDATMLFLRQLILRSQDVKIVQLNRNYGQTAALAAGVDQSSGRVLIFMDGDLQNDPQDIPRLLAKLEEGYDVVSGWRKDRKDAQLSRKLPSWLANKLISRVTGLALHDYGCTLKAYRREVFEHLRLSGDMHRFLPAYAALTGAVISELEVQHHPRRHGVSKYGIGRVPRVILDLLTLKFLGNRRPGHAFGLPGLIGLLLGCLMALCGLVSWKLLPRSRNQHPSLFLLALRLASFGIQSIMLGVLAEVLMRTYREVQGKPIYVIKSVIIPQHVENDVHYEAAHDYAIATSSP